MLEAAVAELPLFRLHLMRAGYLLLGLGLAVGKWPLLVSRGSSLPVMDGVVAALLIALSLLRSWACGTRSGCCRCC